MTEKKNIKKVKKKKTRPAGSYAKYVIGMWIIFLIGVFSLYGFMKAIRYGLFGELPPTEILENPQSPLASEVFSSDGVLMGKYFNENRSNVDYDQISPHMINALIATEDVRFHNHSGIDMKGLFSIPYYNVILGDKRGASTITQQLAKNLFHEHPLGFWGRVKQKLKEWIIAVKLERYYTKEEILQMYFNTVSYGSNTFGIKSAAKTFFNKTPDSLNIQESATLVGVLKATSLFSPIINYENSIKRRNVVLSQMAKYGYITGEELDSLTEMPITLNYKVESHNVGMARYFREYLRLDLRKFCEENGYDLYRDGLKIYTTIDSRMQEYAEEAMEVHLRGLQKDFFEHWKGRDPWGTFDEILESGMKRSDRYKRMKYDKKASNEAIKKRFDRPVKMTVFSYRGPIDTVMSPLDSIKYYKHFLNPGFMAMEPSSGKVLAWVGGIEYKYFKYDHVNPNSKRQVGSTFKPLVFTVAAQNRFSPCQKLPNTPVVFEDYGNWSPKNADGKYGGMLTLKEGLAHSVNCITARVMKEVGPESVVKLAQQMGITSELQAYPSIALGTFEVSVYEMVSAFNTYANKGVWVEPMYISRIEDKNGNILKEFVPRTREVLDETTNYVMLNMLQGVINQGTGQRLRWRYQFENQIAGKTGTTQNNSDGWFIAVTPTLSAGAWVGAEDRAVHFRSTQLGGGHNMALPIWAEFYKRVQSNPELKELYPPVPFEAPQEELNVEIDCSQYETDTEEEEDLLPDVL